MSSVLTILKFRRYINIIYHCSYVAEISNLLIRLFYFRLRIYNIVKECMRKHNLECTVCNNVVKYKCRWDPDGSTIGLVSLIHPVDVIK